MRKTLLLFCLWGTLLSLSGAIPGSPPALACNIALSSFSATGGSGPQYPDGATITLTAVTSGCPAISQMSFYNGGILLGTVASPGSPNTYTFSWNTGTDPSPGGTLAGGPYALTARATYAGSGPVTSTVIDFVGATALGPNPALDLSFGYGGSGSWLQGDNQMCLSSPFYNGSLTDSMSDGSCAWSNGPFPLPPTMPPPSPSLSTIDGLDDTMHTLSDFVVFANTLLNKSVGTLSSTLSSWYPQATVWIGGCDDNSMCGGGVCSGDGSSCVGRLPPLVNSLNTWTPLISNWLAINYTNASAWCLPLQSDPSMSVGAAPTAENNYIAGAGLWGSLPSVIACENYNGSIAVNNYLACQNWLANSTSCPTAATLTGTVCDPVTLGRSLAGPMSGAFSPTTSCGSGTPDAYASWVQGSYTMAFDEANKFILRAQFLNDIYTRAATMQSIFSQGALALSQFLAPGGPAALLQAAQATTPIAQTLPNAVIYGWQDNPPSGNSGGCIDPKTGIRDGCTHLVKVLAYSTGRCGTSSTCRGGGIDSLLPWIQTKTSGFLGTTRSFTLTDRDGYVYVSVRRWDQNHSESVLFPNGRPLWQFLYQNPNVAGSISGQGLPAECIKSGSSILPGGNPVGFGLEQNTLSGLAFNGQILPTDVYLLSRAFMLNDEGTGPNAGMVDESAIIDPADYHNCLFLVNQLLDVAPESHACAEYIAASPQSDPGAVISGGSQASGGDMDYSVKFVPCTDVPGWPFPDDLTG